jgi:carbonic anhydrase
MLKKTGAVVALLAILPLASITGVIYADPHAPLVTKSIQQNLTPDQALNRLVQGNERFVKQDTHKINYIKKAEITATKGQHPAAIVLSCIDSRVPPEIIFDQAVGNIFVTRLAANVENNDVIGGMEFATKLAGAKLIVVMGHDDCGAVKGACLNAKLGKLTQLLSKVKPAIAQTKKQYGKVECNNPKFINAAAKNNVHNVITAIMKKSSVLRNLVKSGKVKIVGAMYHINTGKVSFFDEQ